MRPRERLDEVREAIGGAASRAAADTVPPRGSLGVLRDPVFGPFWAGKLISTAGMWVHNVVAAIITYQLTGSTLLVGAVSMAQFLPQLLFAPLSGAMADRGDPRRQLVLGRVVSAVGSGGLAIALAVLGLDGMPGAWPVIASAGVVGIGFAIGGPAMHSVLPGMVRPAELPTAVALSHLPPTIARSAGPVLGAFLLLTAGPAVAFGFTAVGGLLYAVIILVLPIGRERPQLSRRDGSVRAGLRHLRSDPPVAFLLLGVLALGFGADPVVTLTPALSDTLGRGEQYVGILASAFGIGAAAMFPLLSLLRRTLGLSGIAQTGLGCLAAGMTICGLAPGPAAAVVGMAVAGIGFSLAVTGLTTQLYGRIPELLRGRVMALWSVAFLGSRPLAAAINGTIADASSVTVAFLATAALVAVGATVSTVGVRRPSAAATYPTTARRV